MHILYKTIRNQENIIHGAHRKYHLPRNALLRKTPMSLRSSVVAHLCRPELVEREKVPGQGSLIFIKIEQL